MVRRPAMQNDPIQNERPRMSTFIGAFLRLVIVSLLAVNALRHCSLKLWISR